MRNRLKAASAAVLLFPLAARATVPVEQIEAFEVDGGDNPNAPTRYAPVDFAGNASVLVLPGQLGNAFPNQTFHAVSSGERTTTNSIHGYTVGQYMYGNGDVAYPYVTDIYCLSADTFLGGSTNAQVTTGTAALPGPFDGGAKIINNSYVGTYVGSKDGTITLTANTDLDVQRRIDYMVNAADVTFVAGAVTNVGGTAYQDLVWSSYNALAVSGAQTFSPGSAPPGKPYADLYGGGDASFAAASVSGFAAALYGNAQASVIPSMADALHGVAIRSLLMAGADKTGYTRTTPNNLDTVHGAGLTNYGSSLSILQDGEKSLPTVSGGAVTGTPSGNQKGWAYGSITAGSKKAVLFQATNAITGITASLNWNIDISHTGSTINTNSQLFPHLFLNVYPVTFSGGSYTLGAVFTTLGLSSTDNADNVQYLYSTSTLPAGTYAFVISGDTSLPTSAAFSYSLAGSFASQWNSGSGSSWGTLSAWTNAIPNARAAQANLLASPGLTTPATITLDGSRTVGQMTFANPNSYTIAAGTAPTGLGSSVLVIDDTGNSSGTANPLITVTTGGHTISAPVTLANGVTVSTSPGTALTLGGAVTGTGGLTKTGNGVLTLSAVNTSGDTTINGGLLTLAPAGSITNGTINVNTGGTLNFAASTTAGIFARTVVPPININGTGVVKLALPSPHTARQILIPSGGYTIAGSINAWTGKLDLTSNDVLVAGGNLGTIFNQIKQGYGNGTWTGAGITSSAAASDAKHLTALGVILNNDGGGNKIYGSSTTLGPFDGQDPGAADVLIKYTYYGDANLDGQVDGSDYSLIDYGYNSRLNPSPLTGWLNGDFNYDGKIDGSDYTLIDNAFNTQGGSLTTSAALLASPVNQIASASAVPEPCAGALLTLSATVFAANRRRRSRA